MLLRNHHRPLLVSCPMNEAILQLGLLDDEAIQLDAGALELAALDHPDINLRRYVALLSEMTARLAEVGDDAVSAQAQATALTRIIADEYGFAGDRQTYDDADNADLVRVIDRRLGLPVSLAILYVAAARRVGWSADALNTPGHVLVRLGPHTAPVLIDPFNRGAVVETAQLIGLLSQMLGRHTTPTPEHIAPMANRAVLVRLLMNQATRAEASGDRGRALMLYRRMTMVSPATGHAWWERARLELWEGDVPAARASLSAMLEITRDADLRMQISATLDSLAGAR
jgi:regulator of sirC expression with transglutaminase-like and TPR domain